LPADFRARFGVNVASGLQPENEPLPRQPSMKYGIPVTEIRHNCEITLKMRLLTLTFSRFTRQTQL